MLVAAAALLASCAAPAPPRGAASCAALAGRVVPAAVIGLPSGEATVTAATWTAATPLRVDRGAAVPAVPEHCRVLGRITSRDPAAQAIQFQLNLPSAWNGKALQYGGGGFNGVLVNGLAPLRDAAPGDPLPIARGYATFGTDSGHQAAAFAPQEPGAFALNDEMLENFAYASYKKVHDAALDVMRVYYGRVAERMYYFGGSEGGREGLTMAQRFPADYDGIVSVVPVINWTGLFHAFIRNSLPQFDDWLDAAKAPLIARAVNDTCDALDGLRDGVINNPVACQSQVDLQRLRCPDGRDAGPHCLSDAELSLLRSVHTPYRFSFALANGVTQYPAWLYGHEDSLDGPQALSLVRWLSGTAAPTQPAAATAGTHWLYGSNWIRFAIARDPHFDVRGYRPETFMARVQQTSALMDSTTPDLAAFFAHGGKLIVRENASDRAQSPAMGVAYFDAMTQRLGAAAVERSARLYLSPSSTHTGNARTVGEGRAIPTMADLLDPLDRWVSAGVPPPDAIEQSSKAALPPFATLATRPMCRYPGYPHYVGPDPLQAASYQCRPAPLH